MNPSGCVAQSFTRDRRMRKGKVDVLWPCWMYNITVLVTDDRLNLFERAVIRLVAMGIGDAAAIADSLCLPDTTLPNFILSRLEKKNLVSAGILTDAGRAWMQDASKGRYETVLMYQDRLGGNLLPQVFTRSPSYLLPTPNGGFYLKEIGNDENILKQYCILESTRKLASPTAADVSRAIHEYETMCAHVPYLNDPGPELIRFVDDQAAIRVQPNPRSVFLHCLCVLTPDARDILVDNPFGFGDSQPLLTTALASSRHAGTIKTRLLEMRAKTATKADIASVSNAPFPEIHRDMEDMAKSDSGAAYVRAACAAMEHILRRILQEKNSRDCADLLCNSGIPENLERFVLAARSLDQEVDAESLAFLSVASEEIAKTVRGQTRLKPLFALNLFLATQGPHPLESVLRRSPDVLKTVAQLYRKRNAASHGDDASWMIGHADKERARNIVRALLEAWQPRLATIFDATGSHADVDDTDVERSLLEFFSPSVRKNIAPWLDASLISAEKQFLAYGIEKLAMTDQSVSQACVIHLANLCQRALETASGAVGKKDIIVRAEKSAREAGFSLSEGKLPQVLAGTDEKFITAATQGGKTTLGGQCLAWLLLERKEKLAQYADRCPLLLEHIAELIQLRGHGNEEVSARSVALIRRHIYEDFNLLFGGKADGQGEYYDKRI